MPENKADKQRRFSILIILLAILFLIVWLRPGREPGSHAPLLLPAETMVYVEVRDLNALRSSLPELPLWGGDGQGQKASKNIFNQAQRHLAAFLGNAPELDVGHLLLKVKAVAVALLPVREGESAWVVVLDIDDPEELISQLRTDLELDLKKQKADEKNQDYTIFRATLPLTGRELWVAPIEGSVVLSSVKSPVRWAFKAIRGEYESLATNPVFQSTRANLLNNSNLWAFADYNALSKKTGINLEEISLLGKSSSCGLAISMPTGTDLPVSPLRIVFEDIVEGEPKAVGDGKVYPELLKLVPGGVAYANGFSLEAAGRGRLLKSLVQPLLPAGFTVEDASKAFLDKVVTFAFEKDGRWVRGAAFHQLKAVGAMRAALDETAGDSAMARHLKLGEVQCLYYVTDIIGDEKKEIFAVAMLENGVIFASSPLDLGSILQALAKGNLLEDEGFILQTEANEFDWEKELAFFYSSPAVLADSLDEIPANPGDEAWGNLLRKDVFSACAMRFNEGRTEVRGTFPLYPGPAISIGCWNWWKIVLAIILAPVVLVLGIAILFILIIIILAAYYYIHAWATGTIYTKTVPEPATISPAMREAAGAPAETGSEDTNIDNETEDKGEGNP